MDNKWWEYYVVRYFVGTVIGAVIVAFLSAQPGSPFEARLLTFSEFKDSMFTGVSLIAALGFAFCYVASSPVLTLHATRAHLQFSVLKESWGKHSAALLLSIALTVWSASQLLPPDAAWIIGVIFGIQLFLLLSAFFTNFTHIVSFYDAIASVRAKATPKKGDPPTKDSEYITSYRHLREHGNAFFIVALEAALAYVLYKLPNATCAFAVIVLWILPATASWLLGTVLESRLVSRAPSSHGG